MFPDMIQNSERFVYNNRVIPVLKVHKSLLPSAFFNSGAGEATTQTEVEPVGSLVRNRKSSLCAAIERFPTG